MSAVRRDRVRCYVCRCVVPKDSTWLARQRVPSGAVNTRSAFTYRLVRKCHPHCDSSAQQFNRDAR